MKRRDVVLALVISLAALGCDSGERRQDTSYGRWQPQVPTDQPSTAPGDRQDPERTNVLGTLDPSLSGGEPSPFARPDTDELAAPPSK